MAVRFRKSKSLGKGLKVNLNKKSASVTFGGKGIHHTVSTSGRKTTSVGIPGTGLYYQDIDNGTTKTDSGASSYSTSSDRVGVFAVLLIISIILLLVSLIVLIFNSGTGAIMALISIAGLIFSGKKIKEHADLVNLK